MTALEAGISVAYGTEIVAAGGAGLDHARATTAPRVVGAATSGRFAINRAADGSVVSISEFVAIVSDW